MLDYVSSQLVRYETVNDGEAEAGRVSGAEPEPEAASSYSNSNGSKAKSNGTATGSKHKQSQKHAPVKRQVSRINKYSMPADPLQQFGT